VENDDEGFLALWLLLLDYGMDFMACIKNVNFPNHYLRKAN
jgi:hypothetical protein